MTPNTLALADILAFDPGQGSPDGWTRHCCVICGAGKPRDAAHRSLAVNRRLRCWKCFRCPDSGKLVDAESSFQVKELTDDEWQRFHEEQQSKRLSKEREVRKHDSKIRPLPGTAGARYLAERGISCTSYPEADRVGFSESFCGRPAVMFRIFNERGSLCAVQGRYIDQLEPRMRTIGPSSEGCFETSGAASSPVLRLVEAPIDALSLEQMGLPAMATLGTALPKRVYAEARAGKEIVIATDADEAGDNAAAKWAADLSRRGFKTSRLRPEEGMPAGAKKWDWNDVLKHRLGIH